MSERTARDVDTSEYVQVPASAPPPKFVTADSFDTAADQLQTLIDWAKDAEHRVGYFAAVYKRVTLALKQAAETDQFEDGARMSRLAGIFATRYLMAVNGFFRPAEFTVSESWRASFDQLENPEPVIVQHIQAGINAHTAFDLGMAVNEITGSRDVDAVRNDFLAVNAVLASQAEDMLDMVEEISPDLKRILDAIPGDEALLIGPAIKWMREEAWLFVKTLELFPGTRFNVIPADVKDSWVFVLTSTLFNGLMAVVFDGIAEQESRDVRRNIEVLDRVAGTVANVRTTL